MSLRFTSLSPGDSADLPPSDESTCHVKMAGRGATGTILAKLQAWSCGLGISDARLTVDGLVLLPDDLEDALRRDAEAPQRDDQVQLVRIDPFEDLSLREIGGRPSGPDHVGGWRDDEPDVADLE